MTAEQPTCPDKSIEPIDPNIGKFYDIIQYKTPEDGLYSLLKAIADGDMEYEWVRENAGTFLNSFPPCLYVGKHPEQFTPAICKELLSGIDSPQALRQSEIFHRVMQDPYVTHRYKLAAGESAIFPRNLPDDIREGLERGEWKWPAETEPKKVGGWRATIKRLFS